MVSEGQQRPGQAVREVLKREKDNPELIGVYIDSYAVLKGCNDWIHFLEQNAWEVNWAPVWQKEKWKDIPDIAKIKEFR